MTGLSKQIENQLDSLTGNPFVFCGYQVSHMIVQNTHSRDIFSVHGFLRLSVIATHKFFLMITLSKDLRSYLADEYITSFFFSLYSCNNCVT